MIRAPLSGRNGGAGTNGDCYDPTSKRSLYVEIKHYAANRVPFYALWRDTKEKAKREHRAPVVVVHVKKTHSRFAIVDFDYFCDLLDKAGV